MFSGGLCFWTFCGYFLLFYTAMLLHIGVLFMVLFPGFLMWCSFVASTDVLLGICYQMEGLS
jgi:hypothetical protein